MIRRRIIAKHLFWFHRAKRTGKRWLLGGAGGPLGHSIYLPLDGSCISTHRICPSSAERDSRHGSGGVPSTAAVALLVGRPSSTGTGPSTVAASPVDIRTKKTEDDLRTTTTTQRTDNNSRHLCYLPSRPALPPTISNHKQNTKQRSKDSE